MKTLTTSHTATRRIKPTVESQVQHLANVPFSLDDEVVPYPTGKQNASEIQRVMNFGKLPTSHQQISTIAFASPRALTTLCHAIAQQQGYTLHLHRSGLRDVRVCGEKRSSSSECDFELKFIQRDDGKFEISSEESRFNHKHSNTPVELEERAEDSEKYVEEVEIEQPIRTVPIRHTGDREGARRATTSNSAASAVVSPVYLSDDEEDELALGEGIAQSGQGKGAVSRRTSLRNSGNAMNGRRRSSIDVGGSQKKRHRIELFSDPQYHYQDLPFRTSPRSQPYHLHHSATTPIQSNSASQHHHYTSQTPTYFSQATYHNRSHPSTPRYRFAQSDLRSVSPQMNESPSAYTYSTLSTATNHHSSGTTFSHLLNPIIDTSTPLSSIKSASYRDRHNLLRTQDLLERHLDKKFRMHAELFLDYYGDAESVQEFLVNADRALLILGADGLRRLSEEGDGAFRRGDGDKFVFLISQNRINNR